MKYEDVAWWNGHTNMTQRYLDSEYNPYLTNRISTYKIRDYNTTLVNFKNWLTLYNADPEGWHVGRWSDGDFLAPCYLPPKIVLGEMKFYKNKIIRQDNEPLFVQFPNKKDYKNWVKYVIKLEETGADITNTNEFLKLTTYARMVADWRVKNSQIEVNKLYEDMIDKMKKAGETIE